MFLGHELLQGVPCHRFDSSVVLDLVFAKYIRKGANCHDLRDCTESEVLVIPDLLHVLQRMWRMPATQWNVLSIALANAQLPCQACLCKSRAAARALELKSAL